MTLLAVETEICQRVVGIDCLIEIIDMATLANQRSADKLLTALRDMTGVAIDDNMHPHKRKSPLGVGLQNILSILPVDRRMAIPAFETELGTMNVRMAVGALYPDMRELELLMTVSAIGILMRSCKRKSGFGMRKTGGFLYEIPTLGSMAGVAIPLYIAMGTFPGVKIDKNNH